MCTLLRKYFWFIYSGKIHGRKIPETNSVHIFKVLHAFRPSLHSTEEETEGQRWKVTCPKSIPSTNRFKTQDAYKCRLLNFLKLQMEYVHINRSNKKINIVSIFLDS